MKAEMTDDTQTQESFEEFSLRVRQSLNSRLTRFVNVPTSDPRVDTNSLHEAMAYSLLNGGKRLRPLLVCASYEAITRRTSSEDTLATAAAIECIHAYSLIHDDLPAMDDDTLRRGQPTNHMVYGEANAILAGDALQALAFEILCGTQLSSQQKVDAISALSKASGARGMVGGQFFDLASENKALSEQALSGLHAHKTGALIAVSLELGAIVANATLKQRNALIHYGLNLGLAFQVIDDVLDIESDTQTLGKTQGADIAANKATFPSILGIEASKRYATKLVDDAITQLRDADITAPQLTAIAKFVTERRN